MIGGSVVIDNDALVNLFHLEQKEPGLIRKFSFSFNQIHIPLEVKNEFLFTFDKDRWEFIDSLKIDRGIIRLCSQYDLIDYANIYTLKGIDRGESEVLAQKMSTQSQLIISDDSKFTEAVKSYNHRFEVINSLHVIAIIELTNLSTQCKILKQQLHSCRPFKKKQLKEAYLQISKHLNLNLNSRRIREYAYY